MKVHFSYHFGKSLVAFDITLMKLLQHSDLNPWQFNKVLRGK